MPDREIIWRLFHPNLTRNLLLIILFLSLIALGNLFGIYSAIQMSDNSALTSSIMSFFVYAIPAYGLFFIKQWARWIEIIISSMVVLFFCPLLIFTGNGLFISLLVMIIHGYIVIYLCSAECKKIFSLKKD